MKGPCLPDANDLSKAMRNYARIFLLLVTAKTHCPKHRHDNTMQFVLGELPYTFIFGAFEGESPNDQAVALCGAAVTFCPCLGGSS